MLSKKTITLLFWAALTAIPVAGFVWGMLDPKDFEAAKVVWQARAAEWGAWAPIVFVLTQILQVVITPISHYTVGLVGGFLFGTWYGTLLNWIGRIIGHTVAFWLARRFGRPLIKRFVSDETIKKFDAIVSGKDGGLKQAAALFLIYFLPLFPDDEISYIAGLSAMRFRNFFIANVLGQMGGALSLAYLGSGASTKDPLFWIMTILTLAGFPIIWWLLAKKK
jgi:uncharacterized membrane protein YdjX (TVP38/TMEM64 family)